MLSQEKGEGAKILSFDAAASPPSNPEIFMLKHLLEVSQISSDVFTN